MKSGHVEWAEWIYGVIFDPPDPARPRSLLMAWQRGLIPDWAWPEAEAIMRELDDRPRKPRTGPKRRIGDSDPSWDDVIRAMKEDR
jgi:hypothetical protein